MNDTIHEVRVDGKRRFAGDPKTAREVFWLLADEASGCTVELVGPTGVLDFLDEGRAHA